MLKLALRFNKQSRLGVLSCHHIVGVDSRFQLNINPKLYAKHWHLGSISTPLSDIQYSNSASNSMFSWKPVADEVAPEATGRSM